MLIARKDGTLVHYPVEKALTLNPSTVINECTLGNGVAIRMICQYGEKVLVRDPELVRQALEAEGL
jgi:hypothetical protein